MLVLPIKKQWFEMIANGEKKEEYREIKPYYNRCLGNAIIGFPFTADIIENFESIKSYDENQFKIVDIIFRNGYQKDSPQIKCKCKLNIGMGKEEWGAEPNKKYYILVILEILEIKNFDNPNPSKLKEAMAIAALPATNSITPINSMQEEITKAINKQIGINIDIGESMNRSGQAIKNTMMFGG